MDAAAPGQTDATAQGKMDGAPPSDVDAAAPGDSGAADDGAVPCASGATLYDRLGGHDGIHAAIAAIVGQELGNPDMASYFFNQVASPVPAGHPTADQIEECFTVLLSAVAGGPYSYPPDGGVTTDAGTFACRDMTTIHQPLLISGGTFDEFVSIAATTLAPSVCASDLATIGSALVGTKGAIVYAPLTDAGLQPFPGAEDGGNDQ
ncbi:MAG: hypothetical protein FWD17_13255 [Polyangiaceae bacterium]|nr:hypothetical protein [Polyangiaceae bacterium]